MFRTQVVIKPMSNLFPFGQCLRLFHGFNYVRFILSIAEDLDVMIFSIQQQ